MGYSSSPHFCMNRKLGCSSALNFNITFWYCSCIANTIFQGTLSHPLTSCGLLEYNDSKVGQKSIKTALHSMLYLTILSKWRKKSALSRGSSAWYLVCLSAAAVKDVTASRCSTNYFYLVYKYSFKATLKPRYSSFCSCGESFSSPFFPGCPCSAPAPAVSHRRSFQLCVHKLTVAFAWRTGSVCLLPGYRSCVCMQSV